jgi:hypothetical protein
MPDPTAYAAALRGQATPPPDPLDYTDKYNTQLSPADEQKYQAWAKSLGPQGSTYDYDLRGAYKAGAGQATNGHFTDQFKKPNHPTFSDQSQYSGVNGQQGGSWQALPDGTWSFTPTASMLKMHDPEDLQQYWNRVEPTNKLVLPPPVTPAPAAPVAPTAAGLGG